jgi:hypothetical protein
MRCIFYREFFHARDSLHAHFLKKARAKERAEKNVHIAGSHPRRHPRAKLLQTMTDDGTGRIDLHTMSHSGRKG